MIRKRNEFKTDRDANKDYVIDNGKEKEKAFSTKTIIQIFVWHDSDEKKKACEKKSIYRKKEIKIRQQPYDKDNI